MNTNIKVLEKGWPLKDVITISILSLLSLSVFVLVAYLLKVELAMKSLIIDSGLFLSIVITFFIYKRKNNLSAKGVGLTVTSIKWIFISIFLGILVVIIGGGLSNLFGNLIGLQNSMSDSMNAVISDKVWLNIVNMKILIALMVPFAEELLFRGVIFRYLRQNKSFFISAIISAAIFSLIHFDIATIPFTLLLGFTCAFVYERSKSLLPPIIVHIAVNNLAATMLLLSIK